MINLQKIELIAQKIELKLFKRANALSLGGFRSSFRGAGLQFKEHRSYEWGDDFRLFDWKIWAKTGQAMVKVYEEERNREIFLFMDLAPTMSLGYKGISKLQMSLEMVSLLLMLAEKTGDFIRPILVHQELHDLGRIKGKMGISLLLKRLLDLKVIDEKRSLCYHFERSGSGRDNAKGGSNGYGNDRDFQKKVDNYLKKIYMGRCYYLTFSDFFSFFSAESFSFLLSRPNAYLFRLSSPLDKLDHIPFPLYGQYGRGQLQSANQGSPSSLPLNHKKLSLFSVDEAYLQKFVSELWHGHV